MDGVKVAALLVTLSAPGMGAPPTLTTNVAAVRLLVSIASENVTEIGARVPTPRLLLPGAVESTAGATLSDNAAGTLLPPDPPPPPHAETSKLITTALNDKTLELICIPRPLLRKSLP